MGFPKGRTAFLVIHGIGEQNPFETLDSFTRGLVQHLASQGMTFTLVHQIAEQKGVGGAGWTENFVRLTPPHGEDLIDIHEFYWAYLTEEKITPREVWQWVDQTLQGAIRYYQENVELQTRLEGQKRPYWFRLLSIARALRWVFPLIRVARGLIPGWKWLQAVRDRIEEFGTPIIVGYIGDIAIYTTTDEKSSRYRIRQQILAESQTLLEDILADAQYDRVIVAGHSLGSVIAYDTLNRVNIKANLAAGAGLALHKLERGGLITFGSPLDKIAFFFREHAESEQYVRRQIMEHLHSFKAKVLTFQKPPYLLTNPISPKLDTLRWINYYNDRDPVSGHLDFYQIPDSDNVYLELPDPWGVAHVGYWRHAPFYADIVRRFLP